MSRFTPHQYTVHSTQYTVENLLHTRYYVLGTAADWKEVALC